MRRGFTLVELLVVIAIIGLLAALLLPALTHALCQGRAAVATHLIDQLTQATAAYELDQAAYPPDVAGYESRALVGPLQSPGPRTIPYFPFFQPDMLEAKGNIRNPVWDQTEILYYRNNAPAWPGNATDATAHNKVTFDIWGRGCRGDATEINNWGGP